MTDLFFYVLPRENLLDSNTNTGPDQAKHSMEDLQNSSSLEYLKRQLGIAIQSLHVSTRGEVCDHLKQEVAPS